MAQRTESTEVQALTKRYKDSYLDAKEAVGFGRLIKSIGIAAASLIVAFSVLMLAISRHPDAFQMGIGGIVLGCFMGILLCSLGMLVSALGQVLRTTLDSAVNTSPFLTNEHRAEILSLSNVTSGCGASR